MPETRLRNTTFETQITSPGGYSTKVSWYGEARRRGPIPYLLYAIIHEIGTPFVYLLLTNGTPFTYLV